MIHDDDVVADFFCLTGEIYKFFKQICVNMATNFDPLDRQTVLIYVSVNN